MVKHFEAHIIAIKRFESLFHIYQSTNRVEHNIFLIEHSLCNRITSINKAYKTKVLPGS